ncbi:Crp/Fnr family transcriptional regulator [Paenibacillus baekrokdamisoli]|uniref:Crp/Fnr family transcriptional regulator n=1 Tax=Paenibacillus baekrokdamisoli TaxID=1712516 RepID=A0A3G9JBW5_9BACL|nr:Crp/Fnr family transcriptional regulator [Paenibacillus baekrokdamisoli]MBB3068537.1 CRP/FNR family transcriptional regulator [Paenibacillus baekrokdamisoli]BBH22423.1 Crp/Fnr family transcriptional regulator [Paenibacillus baekrokdamisoli]
MNVERLKSLSFFDDFTTSDMEHTSQYMSEKRYDQNSFIFMEGDIGDELYIVLSGTVEINRFDNGKKFVLSTLQEGDVFGEMSLFDGSECRSANAEVVDKAVLAAIERRNLQGLLETNPGVTYKLLTILIKRLRRANDRIHDITFLDVRTRIYKQLLCLAEEYGITLNQTIMINLRLTQQQIADMVGCTREMVSKVLTELQADHIIVVNKKRIIVKNKHLLSDKVTSF